jgi:hypothetical protein
MVTFVWRLDCNLLASGTSIGPLGVGDFGAAAGAFPSACHVGLSTVSRVCGRWIARITATGLVCREYLRTNTGFYILAGTKMGENLILRLNHDLYAGEQFFSHPWLCKRAVEC